MTAHLAHLAQRIMRTPLVIHPDKADVVLAALAERLGIAKINRARVMEDDEGGTTFEVYDTTPGAMAGPGANPRLGYDKAQGVALITIAGTLVHRLGTLRPYSGMTGYDGIRQNVLTAVADPEVKGILLDLDTPGGEAAGCFDLVDTLYQVRGEKPMWGMVNEMAYSGGVAIASACDRVIIPRTGGIGSVGVVVVHMDWSDAVANAGLTVTIVTYGAHKADGNPFERLSKAVQSRIQSDVDTIGTLFVDTIARNRGISAKSVREQEAECFMGQVGVDAGLADAVMSPEDCFAEFVESLT